MPQWVGYMTHGVVLNSEKVAYCAVIKAIKKHTSSYPPHKEFCRSLH